jgi:hypothetical protein
MGAGAALWDNGGWSGFRLLSRRCAVPALVPLYHEVRDRIGALLDPRAVPDAAATRLALLVTGVLAAESCVIQRVARELDQWALTAATPESIARRLRRALNDPHLAAAACYAPALAAVLDWPAVLAGEGRAVLVVDESTKADEVHLLRVSLAYWGGALPLAWAVWEQNRALPAGGYWAAVDRVLAQVEALLPPGLEVLVLGDRAFAVPALIDRLAARGWRWILRVPTTGSHRFRDARGEEHALRDLVARHLGRPGTRWRARGAAFKDAGWRPVRAVGVWAAGAAEPLVVLTDLPAEWAVLAWFDRRAWIEAGFRQDKAKGWRWEESQVRGVAHHAVLLLALAWASLVALCLGAAEAQARLRRAAAAPIRLRRRQRRAGKPQHPRESVFTLGLACVRGWLYQTAARPFRWALPRLTAPSWEDQWHHAQAHRYIFRSPVRP